MKYTKDVGMLLSIVCLLIGIAVFIRTLRDTILWYSPVPIFDQVTSVWLTNQWLTHTLPLTTFWRWHNEHLIVFPQILFILDVILFRNRSGPLVMTSWALQIVSASVILRAIWKDVSDGYKIVSCAAILLTLFAPSQLENLLWGFQLTFQLTQAFALLSLITVLPAFARILSPTRLVLSMGSAIVASFSLSPGMLIWPCLLFALSVARVKRSYLLSCACCGAIVCGILLWARAVQVPSTFHLRPTLDAFWRFLTTVIGLTWSFGPSPMSIIVTIASFSVLALLVLALLRNDAPTAGSIVTTSAALFFLGWLLLTCYGRSSGPQPQFVASRYQGPVLCYWACLIAGGLDWAFRQKWPVLSAVSIALLAAVIGSRHTVHELESRFQGGAGYLQLTKTSLDVGVYDPVVAGGPLLFGEHTIPDLQLSREYDYSLFSDGLHRLMNDPFPGQWRLQPACAGTIDSKTKVQSDFPGLRLTGSKPARKNTILVVAEKRIVGLGSTVLHNASQWFAYAKPVDGLLEVYATNSESQACLIASASQ